MDLEHRIRQSFARQGFMATIGAQLTRVASGEVEISVPLRPSVAQQQGFAHGGLHFAIGDSAAGYAAVTLLDAQSDVVTTDMTIHYLAPGKGDTILARGSVLKPGKRMLTAQAQVFAVTDGAETLIATMTGTMVRVPLVTD